MHNLYTASPWGMRLWRRLSLLFFFIVLVTTSGILRVNPRTCWPRLIPAVTIKINPVNDAPAADSQSVVTEQSKPTTITLTSSDVERDHLTFNAATFAVHGSLSGTAPYLVYSPARGYIGTDCFTFIANNGKLDSLPAEVAITIAQNTIFIPLIRR